jgi:low temperature requirement protein LtrA
VSHVAERFALFTIIALGETIVVVALGTSISDWKGSAAAVAVFGFASAVAVWWLYFGRGGWQMVRMPSVAAMVVFTYGHLPLVAVLTAFSAGIALAIDDGSAAGLDAGTRCALAGGAALYLVCLTVVQRAAAQDVRRRMEAVRAVTFVALLGLVLGGGALDPVLFAALVALALVALVALELWSEQRVTRVAA